MEEERQPAFEPPRHEPQRGFIAEWTVTIVLLLFGTTSLLQAFVIPTGSMEDTLLIGDHLLVDKLAYAPPGKVSRFVLPYTDVKRGDIIVFRYPVDIQQTFVKRCIGVPGDRHSPGGQEALAERQAGGRAVRLSQDANTSISTATTFRAIPMCRWSIRRTRCSPITWRTAMWWCRPDTISRWATIATRRSTAATGASCRARNIIGKPLVIYWSYEASTDALTTIGVDHFVDLIKHFPTKTRWNRTFRLIHGYPLK